jgi:hypothetical protein
MMESLKRMKKAPALQKDNLKEGIKLAFWSTMPEDFRGISGPS